MQKSKHNQIKTFVEHPIFKDIRFWIILFFLVKLIGITHPPIEASHNWRQSFTNMIARNFLENGPDLMHPQVDNTGSNTGIIGSEFPFLNYLYYWLAKIFGYTHWYGRLINLIFTTIGIYFFHEAVKKLLDKKIAFYATFLLNISIWFIFSRKSMPDTFSVSLVFIGGYFLVRYIQENKRFLLLPYFLFTTIGFLCKIPAIGLLAPLIIIPFTKSIPTPKKISIIALTTVSLTLVFWWYFQWVPHLLSTYKNQLFFPKTIIEGAREISQYKWEFVNQFIFHAFKSHLAFIAFISGVIVILQKKKNLILPLFATLFILLVYAVKTGSVFPLHDYYVIPFVPIMSIMGAYAINALKTKHVLIALFLITSEAMLNQYNDFLFNHKESYKLELESILDEHVSKNELIVINGDKSYQPIYFANRKGWSLSNEQIADKNLIDSLKIEGAKYLIIDQTAVKLDLSYPSIYADEHYCIYDLSK